MNRTIRLATVLLAAAALAACGGQSGSNQATTTQKEAEKVKVQTLESERIAKTLELMQIIGVGPKAAKLLQLAGINSLKALTEAVPSELLEVLLRVNREHNITGVQPDLTVVTDWIEKSKKVANHMQ